MLAEVDLEDLDRFVEGVPFDWFAELRRSAPVWWQRERDGAGYWVVTRHADIVSMERDWRQFSSSAGVTPEGHGARQDLGLLTMDPPHHTRYRKLVNAHFKPRAVARLEPQLREIARPIVKAYARSGGGEFVDEVAAPFPVRVICRLMDVPPEDELDLYRWSNSVVPSQDPEYWVSPEAAAEASACIDAYSGKLLARKRESPGDDWTSALLQAKLDGRPLTEAELRAYLRLLLVGGSETTRTLLAHAALELILHPAELERFVSGEVTSHTAVEELLRWSTPVMQHARRVTSDVEIQGRKLEAGDRVTLWMIAANRDEAAFERPDQLDLGRKPNHHVAFGGGGPHFCLGSHLARLEARVLLEELRPLLPRLRQRAEASRLRSNFFNGIKHLELELEG